jgi:beta-glucosidase
MHKVFSAAALGVGLFLAFAGPNHANADSFPFQNPNLPIAKRVDDLVSRMTLQEKVSQMMNGAPAIPHLGVPAYEWWSEGLHGLWTTPATVFPEPIGLASTFDLNMETQIADAISDEGRAWYNRGLRGIQDPAHAHGLTYFAPNINIFRDPRWGRGQETYGEDPYLTAQFGTVYVKELLGTDPKYIKLIATPKHFAVHSGPEPERHRFNAVVSAYDLNDTYLPAFESTVRKGHAQSVMSAYSSLYGIPDSVSPLLIQEKLRKEWGFGGYVISDYGAVHDISANHHYTATEAEATAAAVKNGCDMTFYHEYDSLPDAVRQGLIDEKQIDVSVKRLFTARMKLGMFDPPSMVPFSRIPDSVIDSPAHRKIALQAARESMVLLKNQGDLLPLGKGIRSLALIGPNADNVTTQGGNYPGTSSKEVSLLQGLNQYAARKGIKVTYVKGCDFTSAGDVHLSPIPSTALASGGEAGLSGKYFSGENLEGTPVTTRQDATVDFNWSQTPPPGLNHDHYSVRWTGTISAPKDGAYTIGVTGDDGFRLFVDEQPVIDDWSNHGAETRTCTVNCKAGNPVPIRLEYYQSEKDAYISLGWSAPGQGPFGPAIAAAEKADAVIFVGGINSNIEGEEGTPGGGDRPTMDLPAVQEQLLEALNGTGKPVVFVLMSGSAMSINWAQEHVPAILQAWYSGEEGGNAITDVLFGNYNPAGRLSVTYYTGLDQLPDFHDYAMKSRTYRYFEGKPLYPFGYGLSYTKFAYDKMEAPATVDAGQPVTVEATVQNVGARAGDEVVELYLRPAPNEKVREINPGQPMPRLILAGFQRINLAPAASKVVKFTLSPEQLLLVNEQGVRALQPGTWQIFVGGGQPDLSGATPAAGSGVSSMLTVH